MSRKRLNLLPPERRIDLRRESMVVSIRRIARVFKAGLFLLTLVAVSIIAGLWVMTVLSSSASSTELAEQVQNYGNLRNKISRHNELLSLLESRGRERVNWSDIVVQISQAAPPGTILTSLAADQNEFQLSLAGTALTRNSLVVFEDRLESLGWVEEVISPRNNLTERTKPSFEFSLLIDQNWISGGVEKEIGN